MLEKCLSGLRRYFTAHHPGGSSDRRSSRQQEPFIAEMDMPASAPSSTASARIL
jgi:hypothetical protein